MMVEEHQLDNRRIQDDIPVVGDEHMLPSVPDMLQPLYGKSCRSLVYDGLYDSGHHRCLELIYPVQVTQPVTKLLLVPGAINKV